MNKAILLVEDNDDDVELTVMAFREANVYFEVATARDGVEALELLLGRGKYVGRDVGDRPPVVLLDLKLPKMDGLEVLQRIRATEQLKRLPVVALTSSKEEQDILNSYDLGANSYIRKPVDFDQFTDAVHQLGLYWLLLNETPPTPGGIT